MRKRDSHIFAKEKHGHYVEPAWCAERLFEAHKFPRSNVIWDPACGWGTITKAAHAAGFIVIGSDVVDRKRHGLIPEKFSKRDFLKTKDFDLVPFSVVCNPPFDHVEEFARHALELGAIKVALIMLVRRLNAAHWMFELPLMRVMLLTPRPSMPPGSWIAKGNKPGGGTQDFCWAIWDRYYQGNPTLSWLARDVGESSRVVLSAPRRVERGSDLVVAGDADRA